MPLHGTLTAKAVFVESWESRFRTPLPPSFPKGRWKEERLTAPGTFNGLTDVAGLRVGSFTDTAAVSGVTVVVCPEGAVGAVDVRGAAPGTRETDLLAPVNLVERVQAVVLCGGSVYGLCAADGVVRWLSAKGWGFPLGGGHVAPIVPAAVLYDLGRGPQFVPPVSAEWGRLACEAAAEGGPLALGCAGAGTGAMAGGIKGGLGSASLVLESGVSVAALMAVNPNGSVVNPATGRLWEIGLELAGEFGERGRRSVRPPAAPAGAAARSTTIGVVATDAALSKVQALKVAQMAHDGLARSIRPAHTMFDGDTVFCLATGRRPLPETPGFFEGGQAQSLSAVGHAAADCTARAVIHAVLQARTLAGIPAFGDLPDR
jgi:L-aminopeptidase/D-esterase-like protein